MSIRKMKEEVKMILMLLYFILGYWACGKTIYANKIRIGTAQNLFIQRFVIGVFLGWILIPIALLKTIFGR